MKFFVNSGKIFPIWFLNMVSKLDYSVYSVEIEDNPYIFVKRQDHSKAVELAAPHEVIYELNHKLYAGTSVENFLSMIKKISKNNQLIYYDNQHCKQNINLEDFCDTVSKEKDLTFYNKEWEVN